MASILTGKSFLRGADMNYYNDNDKKVCRWLENLIGAGLLPPGDVDCRDIREIQASDVEKYMQCHFFAGIGGWPFALEIAGWPNDVPIWTGSCPCQPFSVAGQRRGVDDKRHLWPEFRRLINECRPAIVFGEQVASKLGRAWLSRVRLQMEKLGYGVGAADLCAAGVGAPHIRQRLWWVAGIGSCRMGYSEGNNQRWNSVHRTYRKGEPLGGPGCDSGVADNEEHRRLQVRTEFGRGPERSSEERSQRLGRGKSDSGVADASGSDWRCRECCQKKGIGPDDIGRGRPTGGGKNGDGGNPWEDYVYIPCGDGKMRRIKPGLEPLVDGIPGRVAQLRGLGNAIVPQVAAVFVRAFMDVVEIGG